MKMWRWIFAAWPCLACLLALYQFHSGWMAILLYHAGISVALFYKPGALALMKAGFQKKLALASLLLIPGTAASIAIFLPWVILESRAETAQMLESSLKLAFDSRSEMLFFAIYFCTINPLLEEISWRGIFGLTESRPCLWDLAFCGYHIVVLSWLFGDAWILLIVATIGLTSTSFAWRWMRNQWDGLAMPVITHVCIDAGLLIGVGWIMVKYQV